MKRITSEWVKKADGDYSVAVRESGAQAPVYDIVCYLCEQCIEKYLKAILVENNTDFEKIHDLEELGCLCKEYLPAIESHRDDLIRLTQFGVRVRYPGFGATKKDTKKALSITEKLRSLIRRILDMEDNQPKKS